MHKRNKLTTNAFAFQSNKDRASMVSLSKSSVVALSLFGCWRAFGHWIAIESPFDGDWFWFGFGLVGLVLVLWIWFCFGFGFGFVLVSVWWVWMFGWVFVNGYLLLDCLPKIGIPSPLHRNSIPFASPLHRNSIAIRSPLHRNSIAIWSPFDPHWIPIRSPLDPH